MAGAFALLVGSVPSLVMPSSSPVAVHSEAFKEAMINLIEINTVPYDLARYDRSGLLSGKAGKFVRAGGDYQEPWTRDSAINSWNAASLVEPEIARNTLFAVLDKDDQGRPIVQADDQWWDSVVWVVGAWNHYTVTGDREFLKTSFDVAKRILERMRKERFDAEYGLFEGPSFFNDGIAGYPAPPAPADDSGSSFVLHHPDTDRIMALSTNCVYVGAYQCAAKMAKELGEPNKEFASAADDLKKSINERLWMAEKGLYGYFLHGSGALRGKLDPTEEGSGLSFAILFGVASRDRARAVLKNTHVEPFGITDTYPCFERYEKTPPGRHNVLVWPMVQGLWARAAVKMRSITTLEREMTNLARLARGSKWNFYEIYDAQSGATEGGWQSGRQWDSVPNQTWSATAYLSMVLNGVFGLRFEPSGLRFDPLVPKGWGGARMTGIHYRGAVLDVHLIGEGRRVRSTTLDGRLLVAPSIASTITGKHVIELTMG